MLHDVIEPTVRAAAALIVQSGAPISDAWADYTADEDLIPLKQEADDNLHFVRSTQGDARVEAFNIHPVDPDPESLVFHDPVVAQSTPKAAASIEVDNLGGLTMARHVFKRAFNDGEQEQAAIKAGFSLESKTKIGTGQGSPYAFSQEFTAKVTSEWTKQTGRTKDTGKNSELPLDVLPATNVRAFLAWDEQDMVRHIECFGTYDFGFRIGRRAKHHKRWRWFSGYHQWDSLEHVRAVATGRGSVHFALFHHWVEYPPPVYLVEAIQTPRVHIDQFVPYKGADNIRVVIETIDDQRPVKHSETVDEGDGDEG